MEVTGIEMTVAGIFDQSIYDLSKDVIDTCIFKYLHYKVFLNLKWWKKMYTCLLLLVYDKIYVKSLPLPKKIKCDYTGRDDLTDSMIKLEDRDNYQN